MTTESWVAIAAAAVGLLTWGSDRLGLRLPRQMYWIVLVVSAAVLITSVWLASQQFPAQQPRISSPLTREPRTAPQQSRPSGAEEAHTPPQAQYTPQNSTGQQSADRPVAPEQPPKSILSYHLLHETMEPDQDGSCLRTIDFEADGIIQPSNVLVTVRGPTVTSIHLGQRHGWTTTTGGVSGDAFFQRAEFPQGVQWLKIRTSDCDTQPTMDISFNVTERYTPAKSPAAATSP
jgi:hypothetical protein